MDIEPALVARAALGVVGAALLLRGARIYRPALWMSAFGAGAIGAVAITRGAAPALQVAPLAIAATLAGLVAVGVIACAHRLGLAIVGSVVGGALAFAIAAAVGLAPWLALVGCALGALGLPLLFDRALPVTTPAIGAVFIACALDRVENVVVLGALFAIGVIAQVREHATEEAE